MNEKCSKVLYQLINSKDIVPKAIQKWKTELSLHLDINDSVKDYFKVCFKTTTDTSIQLLQYRILHRILPTNYYLKKIKVISYDVCAFRKEDVETIQRDLIHQFFYFLQVHFVISEHTRRFYQVHSEISEPRKRFPPVHSAISEPTKRFDVDVQGRERSDVHGGVGGDRGEGLHVVGNHEVHLHHSLLVIPSHPGDNGHQPRAYHRHLHSECVLFKNVVEQFM